MPSGLKALGEHPVEIGIIGSGLIELNSCAAASSTRPMERSAPANSFAAKDEVGVAAHGVRPSRERFRFTSELPEGFTLFLAGEDQIVTRASA